MSKAPHRPKKMMDKATLVELKKLHDQGVSYRKLAIQYRELQVSWQTIRRRLSEVVKESKGSR